MKVSFVVPTRPRDFKNFIPEKQFGDLNLNGIETEIFLVEGLHPPAQRNAAIRKSTGDFVFFFDDDISIPADLVSKTISYFKDPQVAGVGGPNLTPEGDTRFAKLCGEALSSFFGTGIASPRWKQGKANFNATEKELHGCFICFRGEIIRKHLFPEDLFPGDENELINRIRKLDYRFYYIPECFVYHERRKTLKSFLKQVFISGRGRAEQTRKEGVSGNLFYIIPVLFGLYVALLPVFVLTNLSSMTISLFPLILYAVLAVCFGLKTALEKKSLFYSFVIPLFLVSHLTYAAGYIRGLFLKKRRKNSKENVVLHFFQQNRRAGG